MQPVYTNTRLNMLTTQVKHIALCIAIFLSAMTVQAQTDQYIGQTSVGKGSVFNYSFTYGANNPDAPFVSPHWSIYLGTIISSSVSHDRMTVYVTVQWGTTTGTGSVTVIDGADTTPGSMN